MTESDLLLEEIAELDAQIFRLKGSMNKGDNGVKLSKLAIINRIRDRCDRWLKALERKGQAA
jgi:hypothetical protein